MELPGEAAGRLAGGALGALGAGLARQRAGRGGELLERPQRIAGAIVRALELRVPRDDPRGRDRECDRDDERAARPRERGDPRVRHLAPPAGAILVPAAAILARP